MKYSDNMQRTISTDSHLLLNAFVDVYILSSLSITGRNTETGHYKKLEAFPRLSEKIVHEQ